MVLEGTVSNVAAFGAFVDIGVHQDGLVHISQMSRGYVANPHDIVRSGDIVRVRVVEVDRRAAASPSPCWWRTRTRCRALADLLSNPRMSVR